MFNILIINGPNLNLLGEREKDKYSNKIQGREFGFEGQDTGYLGCMRLKGWSKKPFKQK